MANALFSDLLSTIADRGRSLLGRLEWPADAATGSNDVATLCDALLSGRGEASGVALAQEALDRYARLTPDEKIAFFRVLATRYGPDPDSLKKAIAAWRDRPGAETESNLHFNAEPRRQELFRRLNRAPGGTAALVRMREDLLDLKRQHPELAIVDRCMTHLLSSWFNRGFLVLRRIDWSTPANVLEKIIRYEAVHEIRDWDDLRRRIDPADRRCYAFFHPALADEPLIFVEVALTEAIPAAIAPLLAETRAIAAPARAKTAVFYSISNCQSGLQGISFGNFLIKQVVEELRRELAGLETFVTLSPVPGFMRWLKSAGPELVDADLLARVADPALAADPARAEALRKPVEALAAEYFLNGKGKDGRVADSVARFHLGNGARLERINFLGDVSLKALRDGAGLMVNYLYDRDAIEANHEAYANLGVVVASNAVKRMARPAKGACKFPRPRPVRAKFDPRGRASMSAYLYDVVSSRFPAPEKVFIENHDGVKTTYRDLAEGSARMAGALVALGVVPGDRVAVQVDKSPEAILLYLGCVRAGAIFLPLNTAYTPAEIAYFLGDAEPRVFVCDPATRDKLAPVAEKAGVAHTVTLGTRRDGTLAEQFAKASPTFNDATRGPDDLAAILYTSGTTGRSKGAMLSHDNLASNALTLVDYWKFTTNDTLIHALPIYHTHGLFVATNTLLLAGGTMIFLPKLDPDLMLRLMPRATSMMGVPTFYTRLLANAGLTKEATKSMRLFISGSAPLLAETHREWHARTGHAILERYGMTETNMNTSNPYGGERVPGSVGFPLPGVSLRITDPETGAPIARGEIGMIEVKGPNVFKGYWRMPDKTAAEFRADGFFITGDLGKIDDKGYVHIVGRGKDLVITGGFNVYPKEVEDEIDAMPGVIESAVIGIPHADFGEGVTAVVVKDAKSSIDEKAVQAALEDRLAKFKQPKRVIFVDDLPRNTMGKVQKNVLRDTYANLYVK